MWICWWDGLTWTQPSWQMLGTGAGSDGLYWRLEHTPHCPEHRCLPTHTWWQMTLTSICVVNTQKKKTRLQRSSPFSIREGQRGKLQSAGDAQNKKGLAKERLLTHLSATARSLSGLKVPSVSMYMAFPSPPPWSMGSCGPTGTVQMKNI